jgi:hypothetical protein
MKNQLTKKIRQPWGDAFFPHVCDIVNIDDYFITQTLFFLWSVSMEDWASGTEKSSTVRREIPVIVILSLVVVLFALSFRARKSDTLRRSVPVVPVSPLIIIRSEGHFSCILAWSAVCCNRAAWQIPKTGGVGLPYKMVLCIKS